MRIVTIVQCIATAAGLIIAPAAFAGIEDSRFDISADKATVNFEVKDVSRREVLQRLFAGTRTELKWVDEAYADEQIVGNFNGSQDAVLFALLKQAEFVASYDKKGELERVVILGPTHKDAMRTSLVTAAQQSVPTDEPMIAIPVGTNDVQQLEPIDAVPVGSGVVGSGAVDLAPTSAMPVASAATQLGPISAIPVASAGVQLVPMSAIPVAGSGH